MRRFLFVLTTLAVLAAGRVVSQAELNSASLPKVGHHQLRILAPALLELILVTTKDPDPAPPTQWNFVGQNFVLQLPGVSQFEVTVNGQLVPVVEVGFKRRPLYAPLKKRDLRLENALYLKLASSIPVGAAVAVKNPTGQLWSDSVIKYEATASADRLNPAIHVNQVGYLPAFPKKAFVGYYLGSLGELPVSANTFRIVDARNGIAVHSGTLVRRADVGYTYSPAPYQQVFEADFSALQTPGNYRLQIPGMGVSFPFRIGNESAAAFARTYALGLYHQRCGCKNELPHTKYEHGVCHSAPASVPDMTYNSVNRFLAESSADYLNNPLHNAPRLKDVDSSLYPFINKGPVDVSGGHHDAGDYSKYTINSAGLIHHLVFAADAFPNAGKLDNLGLPESADGKSDLLQEAKWEADFLAKMQDDDGGFYFLVYPRDRRYEDNVLPDKGDPQIVFPKTTAVTAAAVAALAEIASSPAFKAAYPAEAAAYLQKARAGWSFLTNAIAKFGKNGAYQKITHYGNEFMHDDELAWAAAALFVATGEAQYHQKLMEWYDPSDTKTRRWSWWRLFEGYGCAARTYAFAARTGRLSAGQLNPTYLAKCEAELVAGGDDIARFARQTAYGTSFPDPNKGYRTAGWFFSLERAFELVVAQQIKPKADYLEALLTNLGYEAGANPVNMSYITGLGYRRWRDIVHQYAQNDHRVLPPSGIPLGNIQGGFAYLENYKQELGRLAYPPDGATVAPYPYYDRFGDSFNTTTEFVVMDQARGMAALAYLLAQTGDLTSPSKNMVGTIAGLPQTVPAGEKVTATLNAAGLDLSSALIMWEARDQEPFIGQTFTFVPQNPGEQWVEAEAQLPDGRRVYAKARLEASFPVNGATNPFQSAPVAVSTDMVALYRLDNNLTDATGKNSVLSLFGNASLDAMNLGWMANRQGTALHFRDLGDKATVAIPASSLFTSGVTTEIVIEAMIYVQAYKAYNRSQANLFALTKSWNASLRLMEDTYSGAHLKGGTQFGFTGAALAAAMPVQKWHHLSLSINTTGYTARVNGVIIASAASTELANWNGGTAALELGNFDGWIDELVVRSRTGATHSPSPNQIPTVQFTKPQAGGSFLAPAAILFEANAVDTDGSVAKVEYFNGATKIGEASSSPYAFTWSNVAGGNYSITAVATDNQGAKSQPAVMQVGIAFGNKSPTIRLTKPVTGAIFKAPARILFEAAASDPDGQVTRVEYFVGARKLAERTLAPYSFAWSNIPSGTYAFTAVATDNEGARSTSAVVRVTVSLNQLPTVQFTKPTVGANFAAPALVALEVAASDPDGTVSKVEFFNASQVKLGETLRAPYVLSVSASSAGQHTYTAIATDNSGAKSAPKSITINVGTTPSAPASLVARSASATSVSLSWSDLSDNETGFHIYRSLDDLEYVQCGQTAANVTGFTDSSLQPNTLYHYALKSFNEFGESVEELASVRTPSSVPAGASVAFLGVDATIGGSWKGKLGSLGAAVIADERTLPDWATVTPVGNLEWVWNSQTTATTALQRISTTSRIASCWYSGSSFEVRVELNSRAKVSFYCLDWDNNGRGQRIEVLDAATGTLLHSMDLSHFANGKYPQYQVQGKVRFRFTRLSGHNATVSGFFLDPA